MSAWRRSPAVLLSAFAVLHLASVSLCDVPRMLGGKVTRVSDGDTLILAGEGTKHKVRLYGIDAPEVRHEGVPGQPHGNEARAALKAFCLGRWATVETVDVDMHGRTVGIVRVSGVDVNREMVRRGHAWAYRRFLSSPYASEYLEAEKEARGRRLGLWKEPNPVPPWVFKERIRRGTGVPPSRDAGDSRGGGKKENR